MYFSSVATTASNNFDRENSAVKTFIACFTIPLKSRTLS